MTIRLLAGRGPLSNPGQGASIFDTRLFGKNSHFSSVVGFHVLEIAAHLFVRTHLDEHMSLASHEGHAGLRAVHTRAPKSMRA